jgi:hypothetical protein
MMRYDRSCTIQGWKHTTCDVLYEDGNHGNTQETRLIDRDHEASIIA